MEKTSNGNIPLLADEYLISGDGTQFRVQLSQSSGLRVNGKQLSFDLQRTGRGLFSLILENRSFSLFVEKQFTGAEDCQITVNGHLYCLTVEDRRTQLRKSGLTKQLEARESETIRAPMPGLVVNVEVQPGAEVKSGQGLVVLEAMKMENEIKAASSGRVKAIHVSRGKVVEKGQPLISLEHN